MCLTIPKKLAALYLLSLARVRKRAPKKVEQRIDMKLTESYAMWPAASVCGWYFTHPASNYFTLGCIDEEQAQDYAKRKGWDERDDEVVGCSDEVIYF